MDDVGDTEKEWSASRASVSDRSCAWLFDRAPEQWGLRGDPFLWAELRGRLSGRALPGSEAELVEIIGDELRNAVGGDVLGSSGRFQVDRFTLGSGMSDGWVDAEWWSTTGIDHLAARLRTRLGSGVDGAPKVGTVSDGVETRARDWLGGLTLGDALSAAGVEAADVLAIRHTFKEAGLPSLEAVTPESVIAYTRRQGLSALKFPKEPPRWWLVFLADGGRRSRLYRAYENRGEVVEERTDTIRCYDLVESDFLGSLHERLVVEWSADSINWAKPGSAAREFPIVEISDRDAVPFPGFDRLAVSFAELQAVVSDSRYAAWRTALEAVQGIYLIADGRTGKLYVGKADGSERILGRWRQYAASGHGGNVALREVVGEGADRAHDFTWSLLRVFGSNTTADMVDEAEQHFKDTLLTKGFGYNLN